MTRAIAELLDKTLDDGQNRRGQPYSRRTRFQKGYGELTRILAGLQKEPKRINQCVTLPGAQNYITKYNKKNWQAVEKDITGPNGVPDGINEVIVTDSKGNIKIINGWTLAKSQFPARKAYYLTHPTRDSRRGSPFGEFKREMYQISPNLVDGEPVWQHDLGAVAPEFANYRRMTPRMVYKQLIFKPIYDLVKDNLKAQHLSPMQLAQVFNRVYNYAYKFHIENQALAEMFGQDPDSLDKKTVQKAKKSDDFLRRCEDRISSIVGTPNAVRQTQQEIIDMISDDTHISADVLLADPPEERHAVIRPMTVHGTLQHPQDDQEDDFAATL